MPDYEFTKDPGGWFCPADAGILNPTLGFCSVEDFRVGYYNHQLYIRVILPASMLLSRVDFEGFSYCGSDVNRARVSLWAGMTLGEMRTRQTIEYPADQSYYHKSFASFTPLDVIYVQITAFPRKPTAPATITHPQTPFTIFRLSLT